MSRPPRRRPGASLRLVWLPAVSALAALAGLAAVAQAPAPEPLLFVRVGLPDEALRKMKQQGDYLPLERDKFEEMLDRVYSRVAEGSPARVSVARYVAQLENDALIGDAELTVEHDGERPAVMPLGDCQLAIGEPTWSGMPAETAQLGQDERGRLAVVVPQAGVLRFPWTLRGKSRPGGTVFRLRLPECLACAILLHLPESLAPSLEKGIVRPASSAETPDGCRSWELELGAAADGNQLTVRPAEAPRDATPDVTQELIYRLTPSGLQLQAELNISGERPQRLRLQVGRELRLKARLGETLAPIERPQPGVAEIPLPAGGASSDLLRITGFAELPRGTLWTLPPLSLENARWQEGQTTLLVGGSLRLRRVELDGCRQTARRLTTQGAEELRLRHERPDPEIRIEVDHRGTELSAVGGVTVRWRDQQLDAETKTEVQSQWGEQFELRFALPPQWEVDEVETRPREALDKDRLKLPSGDDILTVPLAQPVAPGAPVVVIIRSHRPLSGPAGQLPGPELHVGRLLGVPHRCYFSVQSELLEDHDLPRVDPTREPASRVIEPLTGGVAFQQGPALDRLRAAPPPQRPQFAATIQVDVLPQEAAVDERYTIRCVPESGPISGLRVQFSQPGGGPLAWELGDGATAVSVRPAGGDAAGARWDLVFAEPQSEAFELRAARQRPLEDRFQVVLASLPEAVSQSGMVRLHNTAGAIEASAPGLEKLPVPLPGAGRQPQVLAVYRYEPSTPAPLVLRPRRQGVRLWAWGQHLVTRCDRQGNAVHTATFRLENLGQRTLTVELPPGSDWIRGLLDGTPLRAAGAATDIRLPPGRRFLTLQVEYRSQHESLGVSGEASAPLLRLSAPVLQTQWSLLLPPGYEAVNPQKTVAERLAGPLNWLSDSPAGDPAAEEAMVLLRTLHAQQEVATWGQLLAEYQSLSDGSLAEPLLVHVASMRNLDVLPTTPLADRFVDLLDQQGLRLRQLGQALILSAESQASPRWSAECVTAGQWASEAVVAPSWPSAQAAASSSRRADGNWQRIERQLSQQETSRRLAVSPVRHRLTRQALASAAVLLVAGMCVLLRRLRIVLAACLGGWATAWLGPAPWDLYGAAAAWGAVLGALLQFAWPRLIRVGPAIGVPAALASLAAAAVLLADDAGPPPLTVHRVLVSDELNEDGEPQDPYAWLPRQFWMDLHKLEQRAAAAPKGWLITSSRYELTLPSPGVPAAGVTLLARCRVRVFQSDTTVSLPFARDDGAALLRSAVDGVDTPFRWNEAGDRLTFVAPAARTFDVELVLRPVVQRVDDGRELQLGIPAVPRSACIIALPAESTSVDVVTAVGVSRRDGPGQQLAADLGAATRLTVRWQDGEDGSRGSAAQVEEHLWMKVSPGSVVLESLLRFHSDVPLTRVSLLADPDMRLLQLSVDGKKLSPQRSATAAGTLLEAPVETPDTQVEVRASFLVNSFGVGRLRPPLLQGVSDGPPRRWLALSINDPLLEGQIFGAAERIDSAEFLVSWPEAAGPMQVVRCARSDDVIVDISYVPPAAAAAQKAQLLLSRHQTAVRFDAQLEGLDELTLRHELRVPAGLRVESLQVLAPDGSEAGQRHVLDDDGVLTIFLDEPATPRQQILLRGSLRAPGLNRPLPKLDLTSAEVRSRQLEIVRRGDIRDVQIHRPRQLDVDTSEAGRHVPGAGRAVAQLAPLAENYAAQLRAVANDLQASAQLLTHLTREKNKWVAELTGTLDVASGEIDMLRLRVPDNWGPLLDSPDDFAVSLAKSGAQTELRLIPRQPIDGPLVFRLRSQLEAGADGVTRAPDISLRDIDAERFLALPRQVEEQQFAWVTRRGLQAAQLPAPLSAAAELAAPSDVFEVVDRRFEAIVQRVERMTGVPLVRLADVHAAWLGRHCQGLALFDLEPAGLNHCTVAMPPRCELLLATVDDVAVVAEPDQTEDGRWRIPLGPDQLPQRIAVLYRGRLSDEEPHVVLPAPTIDGVQTVRTLWNVDCPYGSPPVAAAPADSAHSPARQELYRLESISGLLDIASSVAAEIPTEEVADWYTPWVRRLANSQKKLQQLPLDEDTAARVRAFLEDQDSVAARLRMEETLREARSGGRPPATAADVRQVAQMPASQRIYSSTQGPSARLRVQLERDDSRQLAWWLAALVLAAAVARLAPLGEWLVQWPMLFLSLIGVAALVILPWPWFGWLLIAVAMLASLRR